MRRTYRLIISIMLPTLLLGVLWLPLPSWGLTLEEAKTQGVVGEQPNGYLGVVQSGASAEVQALVNDVNRKRRHMYEDIAHRNIYEDRRRCFLCIPSRQLQSQRHALGSES